MGLSVGLYLSWWCWFLCLRIALLPGMGFGSKAPWTAWRRGQGRTSLRPFHLSSQFRAGPGGWAAPSHTHSRARESCELVPRWRPQGALRQLSAPGSARFSLSFVIGSQNSLESCRAGLGRAHFKATDLSDSLPSVPREALR